jgi:hypothetical protein
LVPPDFIRNPASPEFASIRARLAVGYVEHKADLAAPHASAGRVDEITPATVCRVGQGAQHQQPALAVALSLVCRDRRRFDNGNSKSEGPSG